MHRLSRLPTRSFKTAGRVRFLSSQPDKQPFSTDLRQQLNSLSDRLQIWARLNAAVLRQRANHLTSSAVITLQDAGGKLNKVTGYDEIEALKKRVVEIERSISALRQSEKDAKAAYEDAVAQRASCQREVNELLQRKSSWTDQDVVRFTSLVRQDHANEQAENTAKLALATQEASVEREFNELMRAILNRYHEEQVWSDKIRSASTYGSLMVMGVNIAVFILAIVIVEPYKRKRLAQTFEKRIEEISQENKTLLAATTQSLLEHFDKQEAVLSQIAAASSPSPVLTIPTPGVDEVPAEPEAELPPREAPLHLPWPIPLDKETAKVAGSFVGGGALVWLLMSLSGR